MAVALTDYLAELRRLLHDPSDQYWGTSDKIANLNKAIKMRDIVTGANRVTYEFSMVAGTDTYSFATIGNAAIFDVIMLYVIFSSQRIALGYLSFSEMNAEVRQYSPVFRERPQVWTRYGSNNVIVAPAPASAYDAEADCAIYSSTLLADLTDEDVLDYPFTEPVPYYAAYLCKRNERQSDEAVEFLDEFNRLVAVLTGNRVGTVPSMYSSH